MGAPARRPERVYRENRYYQVRGELRIRGRRYSILEHLGSKHRPRMLVDDPATRQLRAVLVLPADCSTAQHLHVLRRLPQLAELPQILDYERQGETIVILLSWVRGIDLGHYLAKVKRGQAATPSPYEALRLVRGLAHALHRLNQHAHIVHADLKPQNLIVTRKVSRLVMIDFGSAWPIEQTLYRVQGDGRSPIYAAPEIQTDQPRLPTLADQFSASLILYQLLTGEIPYSGLGGQAGRPGYESEFCEGNPPVSAQSQAVRQLPSEFQRALDGLLARGLALAPEHRFQTTSAWLDAIEHLFLRLKLHQSGHPTPRSAWTRFLDAITDRFLGSDHQ